MKRTLWITLLAIVGFAIILLVRMPASWLLGFLPPNIQCADVLGHGVGRRRAAALLTTALRSALSPGS